MAQWIYNPDTLLYESVDEPRWKHLLKIAALLCGASVIVTFNLWLYVFVFGFELPRTASLQKNNLIWQAKLEVVNRHLDFYEQTLAGLEDRDDEVYRAIYGLNAAPAPSFDEISSKYSELDEGGASFSLKRTVRRMDQLSKRTVVRSSSLDEIHLVVNQSGDMISCIPSVPPLCPDLNIVRKSSSFGYRSDPVRGGGEYHQGVDFATKRGYPIYATGEGTVELSEFKFRGYGNEVVIDHGYGYKTRYAHMNTIEVTEGMKVKRGERIGSVGNSGKSTGPHLHYEVIYRDKRVNPMNYMDFSMPVSEYNAMIMTRADESPYDKRRSTTELLRRRRGEND